MKALLATGISLALSAAVIGNAYYQKKQFYPSVVYLTNSNPSMAVMYIQAFIIVLLLGKIMRKIFFGQLRAAEFEHLMERSWYAITETCLAFTVFRDDFNPKFIALFTVLLFLKAFHWLAEDRVDYMERSPIISWLFHTRIVSLLLLLAQLDMFFIVHAYQVTAAKGPSVQLVFGFEYAILIIMIVNISIKYVLHAIDSHWEAPWESKAAVLLYTELAVNFLKVLLYLAFVAVMVRIYTLPLFAFRPMYYTMRSFKKAFNDVVLSRRAIRNMNTLYPDATAEELAAADNVCIICREEMHTGAKKLPCNHIFHAACLRSWFQRQQTCPTCRLNVLRAPAAAAPPPAPGAHAPHPAPQPNQRQAPPPFQLPPFAMPPPPMMGMAMGMGMPPMPPMPPLPPRPPNFGALTPGELQRLEGTERRHVEARLELLREIQTMLDTSVLLMQQYSNAVNLPAPLVIHAASQTEQTDAAPSATSTESDKKIKIEPTSAPPVSEPGSSTSAPPVSEPGPSTSAPLVSGLGPSTSAPPVSGPGPSTSASTSAANVLETKLPADLKNMKTEPSSIADRFSGDSATKRDAGDAETEELRRRRLQKFSQDK